LREYGVEAGADIESFVFCRYQYGNLNHRFVSPNRCRMQTFSAGDEMRVALAETLPLLPDPPPLTWNSPQSRTDSECRYPHPPHRPKKSMPLKAGNLYIRTASLVFST
jgi:hypothetical protein